MRTRTLLTAATLTVLVAGGGEMLLSQAEAASPATPAVASLPSVRYVVRDAPKELSWPDANASLKPLQLQTGLASPAVAVAALGTGLSSVAKNLLAGSEVTVESYSYSNSAYGQIQPDGSVELTYTDTPVWLIRVPLAAPMDGGGVGGPRAATATSSRSSGCSYYFIVDARDGSFMTSGQECDYVEPPVPLSSGVEK